MTDAPRAKLLSGFAAIYILWGATFLAIRYAVADIPPLLMMGLRCAGGAAVLFAWIAARGQLRRPTRAQWRVAGIAGTLLFLFGHGVLAWAEQRVTSGHAALLMTAIPLWLVLLTALHERRAPAARAVAGLIVGVLGIAVLAGGTGVSSGTSVESLALVLAALAWALGSLVARNGARPDSAIQSTAMQLAAGAAVVLVASVAAGELAGWTPASVTPRAASALLFLILGGTVIGFGAYTWLLRVTTPAAVGTFAFVNPIVALGLAWAVGDEAPSLRTLVAALLVIGAVIVTRPGSRAAPPRTAEGDTSVPPPLPRRTRAA